MVGCGCEFYTASGRMDDTPHMQHGVSDLVVLS